MSVDERHDPGWIGRAARVLSGGVLGTSQMASSFGFVPAMGSGAYLEDIRGRRFLDYTMGSGALILGYSPELVLKAMQSQAQQLMHVFAYLNTPAIELAECIVEAVASAESVRFTASGGEATAYAMRLARAHTERNLILKFEGGYHGFHDYAIHNFNTGTVAEYPRSVPDSAGIPPDVSQQVLVAPYNDLDVLGDIVKKYGSDLAAIVVEPVQRAIEPVAGFLQGLRTICDRVGACLVFDEVVTGFRLSLGGAQEFYGVSPDITALGKIVGGGMPLAAVCGAREIMQRFAPGYGDGYVYQSGTMNGHPVAASCGLATLQSLRSDPPYEYLDSLGRRLRNGIASACRDAGFDAQVIGVGSLWQPLMHRDPIYSASDIWSSDRQWLLRFHDGLIANGILVWRGNRSFISAAHTVADIDHTIDVARAVLAEMAETS